MSKWAKTPAGQLDIANMTQRIDQYCAGHIEKGYQEGQLASAGRSTDVTDSKIAPHQPFLPFEAAPTTAQSYDSDIVAPHCCPVSCSEL